ncbi:hypothetical protein B4113_0594 [Geobacillus sp. B4113_201601]|nr:hypothetical protein B4113_0594 [Geobacillus sp. B4113_201601]
MEFLTNRANRLFFTSLLVLGHAVARREGAGARERRNAGPKQDRRLAPLGKKPIRPKPVD